MPNVIVSTLGRAILDATPVGVLPGSWSRNPNPPFFPGGVDGNAYQGPYQRNLRRPRCFLDAVADNTTFTAAILSGLTTLTAGDLSAISGGVSLHNGNDGQTVVGAKLDTMQLVVQGKEGPLSWRMSFEGAGAPTAFSTAGTLLTDAPVPNWWVYRPSAAVPPFIRFSLNMAYNLVPNQEVGTVVSQYASEVNAGNPIFTGSFLFNAPQVTNLVNEQDFTITVRTNAAATPDTVTILFEEPIWHVDTDKEIGRPFSTVEVPVTFRRKSADGAAPISFS